MISLFKQSIATRDVPEEWTSVWIILVFKKGSRSDPANYRPVSLTCILCKLMEHVLCTHIRGHLDRHGILTPENHGFRSKHSCETQLLLTSHDLLQQRDVDHQINVTILDFSKAFEETLGKAWAIWHYRGGVHKWISDFLVRRKQSVVVDEAGPEERPQRSVLGPLIFLLHINDIVIAIDPNTKCSGEATMDWNIQWIFQ